MCRAEMHLGKLSKCRRSRSLDNTPRRFLNRSGNTSSERQTKALARSFEPIDERFPRQNGSGRDCYVGFRLRPLLQANVLTVLQKRSFDHAGVSKLIRQRPRTIGFFFEQILDDSRVSPAEETVEVGKLFIEVVVSFGSDKYDVEYNPGCLPNRLRQFVDSRVGTDSFAILDPAIDKRARDGEIREYTRDDERSKEVAFAAFIDSEVRLEHFRRVYLFIAETRFAQDLWLQLKAHEILDAAPLKEKLATFLINRHAQLILPGEEKGVRAIRKIEALLLE